MYFISPVSCKKFVAYFVIFSRFFSSLPLLLFVSLYFIYLFVCLSHCFLVAGQKKNKCFCCGLCGANNLWQTLNCMPLLLLLRFFCRFHSFIQNYKINCKNDWKKGSCGNGGTKHKAIYKNWETKNFVNNT